MNICSKHKDKDKDCPICNMVVTFNESQLSAYKELWLIEAKAKIDKMSAEEFEEFLIGCEDK